MWKLFFFVCISDVMMDQVLVPELYPLSSLKIWKFGGKGEKKLLLANIVENHARDCKFFGVLLLAGLVLVSSTKTVQLHEANDEPNLY